MIRKASSAAAMAAVLVSLTGCVAPKYNYVPHATNLSAPAIGTTATASVGDNMLSQGILYDRAAIRLDKDVKIGLFGAYTLRHGYYVKTGDNGKMEFYQPSQTPDGGRIDKAALSDPYQSAAAYISSNKVCVITVFNAYVCEKTDDFVRVTKPMPTDDSFQQTLIYSGKVGQKIKVGYREFSGNVARPAFSNDVDYDLDESRVVGYKGARLEIIEATNDHITYRVIANFNKASL